MVAAEAATPALNDPFEIAGARGEKRAINNCFFVRTG